MADLMDFSWMRHDREALTKKIIAQFSNRKWVRLNQRLEKIGVKDKRALLLHIDSQNPAPCLVLEARLGMDKEMKMSDTFIGKAREINTVGDIIANVHGIRYIHGI